MKLCTSICGKPGEEQPAKITMRTFVKGYFCIKCNDMKKTHHLKGDLQ